MNTDPKETPDFQQITASWAQDVAQLRQNFLMTESEFISFSRDRGIAVSGLIEGDPGRFHARGWLSKDGVDVDNRPKFHVFRLYVIHRILKILDLRITRSSVLEPEGILRLTKLMLSQLPSADGISRLARHWNQLVDLVILLEPCYWPGIAGQFMSDARMPADDCRNRLSQYRLQVSDLVSSLDAAEWEVAHEELRKDAASLDDNGDLYLLLRVANWEKRKTLTGRISGALWIRHIAEVLRRGFEEAQRVSWPEEDQSISIHYQRGRKLTFGSPRPLDDVLKAKPYMAYNFGLFTGSTVRWYFEGETEYYATLTILSEPSKLGIELVNLRGAIATERHNAALKLGDWLKEDKALRRFSIITFDTDEKSNFRAIQRQVMEGNVIGHIAAHDPDFEFANFAISELAEVAARLDESYDLSGDQIRNADWTGAITGKSFAARWRAITPRKGAGDKGELWGRALAAYALENPFRSDNGKERSMLRAVPNALYSRVAHYDLARDYSGFDPKTFEATRHEFVDYSPILGKD